MLSMEQLRDAVECTGGKCSGCMMVDLKGTKSCIKRAARTALSLREMLQKIIDNKYEPDKMYLYAEKAEKLIKGE